MEKIKIISQELKYIKNFNKQKEIFEKVFTLLSEIEAKSLEELKVIRQVIRYYNWWCKYYEEEPLLVDKLLSSINEKKLLISHYRVSYDILSKDFKYYYRVSPYQDEGVHPVSNMFSLFEDPIYCLEEV